MALKKIAIIPARSGSKGLPNKNILMLLDKPLIAYTIEAAIKSAVFERVIVSTDSLEYKQIAEQYGAEVLMRNEDLATDSATSFLVIKDILNKVKDFDYFVLLQPTSPFRTDAHIKEAVYLFENSDFANFLVSVGESDKSADLIKAIDADLSLKYFDVDFSNYRRQNKKVYTPNGAIFIGLNEEYLLKKHFFGKDSIAFIMNKSDSVDIDDKLDFDLAITIQTQKKKKEILLNNILKRIDEKKSSMNKLHPITLIGHSIFDYWNIEKINGLSVNNLGIAGVNTKEYLDFILKSNLITNLGDNVIILSGSNDIVINDWTEQSTLDWLNQTVNQLKRINPAVKVYLLSLPPVRGRIERSNVVINSLNTFLKEHIKDVEWGELSSDFYDSFGNLKTEYTCDGLHFTPQAYKQLEKEVTELIK